MSWYRLQELICIVLYDPTNKYKLNVNNRNTRERCEICLKLAINITEQLHNVILMFRPFSMIIFLFLYELMINYRQTSL